MTSVVTELAALRARLMVGGRWCTEDHDLTQTRAGDTGGGIVLALTCPRSGVLARVAVPPDRADTATYPALSPTITRFVDATEAAHELALARAAFLRTFALLEAAEEAEADALERVADVTNHAGTED